MDNRNNYQETNTPTYEEAKNYTKVDRTSEAVMKADAITYAKKDWPIINKVLDEMGVTDENFKNKTKKALVKIKYSEIYAKRIVARQQKAEADDSFGSMLEEVLAPKVEVAENTVNPAMPLETKSLFDQ